MQYTEQDLQYLSFFDRQKLLDEIKKQEIFAFNREVNPSCFQPVEYKVLVKLDGVEEVTKGGLYIPDTVRSQHRPAQIKATMIAAGAISYMKPSLLKVVVLL